MTHQQRSWLIRTIADMSSTSRVLATLALLGLLAVTSGTANAAELRISSGAPYMCADVYGNSIADGTSVQGWWCHGDFNQQWKYIAGQFVGIGTTSVGSKCLDIRGGGVAPGTPVQLYHCNGGANQQWMIFNGANFGFPNSTLIYNPQSGTCLESHGFGKQLTIETCNGSTSQNWTVE